MKSFLLTCALIVLASVSAMGQYYHTAFGHNRIQYDRFDWYYYSTNNFDIYYYPGGHEYAQQAIKFLEDEFVNLTDQLGYSPYTKTKIFIYNSLQDLQQSNIGIGGDVFTIGGKTDFVKLQVEIAYPGSSYEFQREMIHQLGYVLMNDMMFGGSLAEIFQNSYLLSLPEWFIGGAARYMAYGWSQEMDDHVRDYLAHKKVNKLVKIQHDDARVIGQSIWNYIALRYGESSISNILNLTRIIRNEENSISSTLGINFKDFLKDWQNYYLYQDEEIEENYKSPSTENALAVFKNKEVALANVKINSSGSKLAYTYHKNGKYEVRVVDLESDKEEVVVKGGYLINNQQTDTKLPLLDWQTDHTLGVVLYKRGDLYLNTYDLNTKERFQKALKRFRQIESFCFNENGKLAVVSGDVDGQNDLFLISMRRNALKRITNDLYDDIDPTFVPGTAAIVFSSNRVLDSVKVRDVEFNEINNNYNLFVYDLDTTTNKFLRLTNTFSVDRKPIARSQNEIFYLSDQKGISNVYRYSLSDSIFEQITEYHHSILDFDLSFNTQGKLAFLMLDDGTEKVFLDNSFDPTVSTFSPQTGRQRVKQAKYIVNRVPTKVAPVPEPIIEAVPIEEADLESFVFPEQFTFEDAPTEQVVTEDDGLIDTDNYVFEEETKTAFRPDSFFSNYRKFERKSTVIGPLGYEPQFSFSNLVTSFGVDPMRGLSILLETEITDVLENHRLNGGLNADTDFSNAKIYGEYQFLKYWMDFRLRFERNTYLLDSDNTPFLRTTTSTEDGVIQRYRLNRIELGAALPLTNTFRFEFSPFYAGTQFTNLHPDAVSGNTNIGLAANNNVHYAGVRGALVLDNTLEKGFNIYQGTKGLIEFENYSGVSDFDKSFSRINVDLRHYQKIHKELTLAGRLFYGKSFGANSQAYMLGGMDNWVFQQFADQGTDNPLSMDNAVDNSNILFSRFVTNLRGFDYNEIYGTDVLVFNAELRFPIFRYLSNSPISSAFLRNFQLVGFYDIGSAWTGPSPFSKEGSTFTKKFFDPNRPFNAEIADFQNPWLSSYGMGFRTVLFGYYVKLDIANPIKDFRVEDRRFHLTLGLDF